LLAKGVDRLTACDRAAEKGKTEVLEKLSGWCTEVQDNRKDNFLPAKQ
jgi:hypothetical protein